MSVYYIRHLYIHIMFKKCQKYVKIISGVRTPDFTFFFYYKNIILFLMVSEVQTPNLIYIMHCSYQIKG